MGDSSLLFSSCLFHVLSDFRCLHLVAGILVLCLWLCVGCRGAGSTCIRHLPLNERTYHQAVRANQRRGRIFVK